MYKEIVILSLALQTHIRLYYKGLDNGKQNFKANLEQQAFS